MIDLFWQVTGLASFITFSALGLVMRRQVTRMDIRRTQRRESR